MTIIRKRKINLREKIKNKLYNFTEYTGNLSS